jgi:sec1 family domain-containing protein 1
LEDNLFTLEIPKVTSNIFNFNERQSTSIIDSSVSGIFSVLMSFGCCAPIICTQKQAPGLATLICGKLESKIRNHLINTKSQLSLSNPQASTNQPRPLLLVVDRRIDLAGPLKHSASYNALIDEILGINSNQIQIPDGKLFDIDRRDWFWRENSTKPFPKVAEAVELALKTYKIEYDRVLQTTPGMTEDIMKSAGDVNSSNSTTTTLTPEQLKIAINVLPELTERKRLIDTHLQISTALLDSIKTRDLGTLFNIEQEISNSYLTSTSQVSGNNIFSTLKDSKIGNSNDKIRFFLIFLIYNFKNLSNSNFIQESLDILKPNSDDLKAIQSVLNILTGDHSTVVTKPADFSKPNSPINQTPNIPTSNFGDLFNRISSTTNVLVSTVKNLIPVGGVAESPLTKLVDSTYVQVTTGKQSIPISIIDPRPKTAQFNQNVHSIDHVILFIIGGAAYSEYDNLLDHFEKSKLLQNLNFTFGVTEILNPKKYLNHLSDIERVHN